MHPEAYAYVERAVRGRVFGLVLEFGSLNINGSVRDLFACESYHGIDLQAGPGVDEVMDAARWPGSGTTDAVVCCEVLEHAPDPAAILASAFASLRPLGELIVTCAADPREPHSAVDGGPLRAEEHYRNIDALELTAQANQIGFLVTDAQMHPRGDLYMRMERPA